MKVLTVTSASVLALVVASGIAAAQQLSFDVNRISDSGIGEKIGIGHVFQRSCQLGRVNPNEAAASQVYVLGVLWSAALGFDLLWMISCTGQAPHVGHIFCANVPTAFAK